MEIVDTFTYIVKSAFTELGFTEILIQVRSKARFIKKRKRKWFFITSNVMLSLLVDDILKKKVRHEREESMQEKMKMT